MKTALSALLALLALLALSALTPAGALAQVDSEELADAGKRALASKDYDTARETFIRGLRLSLEADDQESAARFYFYSGLTEQVQGEASGEPWLLERAEGYYRRALRLKPDSGSAMVNLAQVLTGLGQTEEAEKWYRESLRLEDERRPVYLTSYAEFLEAQGRDSDALRLYRSLAKEDPNNKAAGRALASHYRDPEVDWRELQAHLWELARRGEVDQAIGLALDSMEGRSGQQREELLTVIAAALSRRVGTPQSFLDSAVAKRLWGFSRDSNIGQGVRQLFEVYELLAAHADSRGDWVDGGPYRDLDLSWWARGDRHQDPEIGMYPRDAMRRLMRSLGERYQQKKQYWVAEACFDKAASFTADEPDPMAIRDLVNLYALEGREDEIEQVANRYVFDLFEGKGQAYRSSQLEKIYQYHRTLGQIYGHLAESTGDWGNSGKVDSAIFQLERAMSVGRQLDEADEQQDGHDVHVDPGLVTRLAEAYDATGERSRADDLRLDAAKKYEAAGDDRAKKVVLRDVESAELEAPQRHDYEVLMQSRPERDGQVDSGPAEQLERDRVDRADQVDRGQVQREEVYREMLEQQQIDRGQIDRVDPGRERFEAQSPETVQQLEVRSNPKTLSKVDEALVQKYLSNLMNQKVGDPRTYWLRSGAPGRLLKLDAESGRAWLEVDGETIEIKLDSGR